MEPLFPNDFQIFHGSGGCPHFKAIFVFLPGAAAPNSKELNYMPEIGRPYFKAIFIFSHGAAAPISKKYCVKC
jgi:hypothetical protein